MFSLCLLYAFLKLLPVFYHSWQRVPSFYNFRHVFDEVAPSKCETPRSNLSMNTHLHINILRKSLKCFKSFAAVPLSTLKIRQLFSWPGLKGRIRIRIRKDLSKVSGSTTQEVFPGSSYITLNSRFFEVERTRHDTKARLAWTVRVTFFS
jgi:hypothetical protein